MLNTIALVKGSWYRSSDPDKHAEYTHRKQVSILLKFTAPGVVTLKSNIPILTIGRDSGNNIILDDNTVSRRHCLIRIGPKSWELEDLGSTFGTTVLRMLARNKLERNKPFELKDNDQILIGPNTVLQVFDA